MTVTAAGKRTKRITVERHNGNLVNSEPTYRHDADWEQVLVAWAAYRDVTGGETVRGRQMEAHTSGLMTLPSTPRTRAISPKMRVRFGGRTLYVVNNLDADGMDRERVLQVSEVTP